jgi:GNAT superfamily N-acetyltransferase
MTRLLEWDSEFFGFKTGKLDALNLSKDELVTQLKKIKSSGFRLIYLFAPHDDSSLKKEILRVGGKLADEKVTFSMNISGFDPLSTGFIHSCKGVEMDNDLESLALESGIYSRFKTDNLIPENKFEDLYQTWMGNSLNGKFAKDVFTFEEDGKKIGMVSIDIRNNEGWIGLIAVDQKFRGRSVGKFLIHAVIRFCQDNQLTILNVQTQLANKESCTFYEKVGFKIRNIEDIYHLWN